VTRRAWAAVVLAVGLLLAAAGCGGRATSSDDIVVGGIGSYTGTLAPSFGGARQVLQAWAASVNAAGGIRGRHVRLVLEDDRGEPALAQQLVTKMITRDHVVAIVGESSDVDSIWASYVTKQGVPVIGGSPANIAFSIYSDFFPSGASGIAAIYGAEQFALQNGPQFGFLGCSGTQLCALSLPAAFEIAKASGTKVAFGDNVSASATDYTADCQALRQAKVESYLLATDSATSLRIAAACRTQGLTAQIITTDGAVTRSWAKAPAVDGALSAELDFPFVDTSAPATRAYQTALAKYAPDLGDLAGPGASYAWVAGKLFEAAIAHAPPGPITPATIKTGLYALHGETLGGLAPPLTYRVGQPSFVSCYFTLGVSGGAFTEPNGLRTTCLPPAIVAAALKRIR
jgi:branched-chain amino acid transport system substrate-binding protein